MTTRWFHYTLATTLLQIIADRTIRRAMKNVPKGERPVVWFSCRREWEPTATKVYVSHTGTRRDATIAEMVHARGALVRLEVPGDVARHTWETYRRQSGIEPRLADALEKAARRQGANPAEWRVSFHDVPVVTVLSVEASQDGWTWTHVGWLPDGGTGLRLELNFIDIIRAALERRRRE